MKILANSVILVLALVTILTFPGCDKPPPPPTIIEVQLGKLNGPWDLKGTGANVTLDGVSKTSDYTNFKLTLSGTVDAEDYTYSTAGRPALSPWKDGGKWVFGESVEGMLIRDPGITADELDMTYNVDGETLQIIFTFTKSGYAARTEKVTGEWVFTMTKE